MCRRPYKASMTKQQQSCFTADGEVTWHRDHKHTNANATTTAPLNGPRGAGDASTSPAQDGANPKKGRGMKAERHYNFWENTAQTLCEIFTNPLFREEIEYREGGAYVDPHWDGQTEYSTWAKQAQELKLSVAP